MDCSFLDRVGASSSLTAKTTNLSLALRLHPNVHMGQETGKLGEGVRFGGSGRGEPTIITPKQNRQRFLGAMERYFTLIPDRWMKQRDSPEFAEDSHLLGLWPDW
ncbi:hypothetical protein C8R47DRAFT_1072591 [Mycena vitilis]|nr:hypothetical protein C8R47DRAFT_1072591 [Mycena vitilis]